MIDQRELFAGIDRRASLDFLARMIRFQSYSGTPGEGELARFMVDAMKRIGLEAFVQPVEGERVNAIGRWRGAGGGKSLMFNGHLDTNPVTEGWTVDPLGGVVDDRFVYGIGVSNMKASDAAAFCAVKTLVERGVRLNGDVVLTFVVGELQGGVGTVKTIDEGIRADYFINGEPTDLAGLTLHAGAFSWSIELTGTTRHMSKREEAVDALVAGGGPGAPAQRDDLERRDERGARRGQSRARRRASAPGSRARCTSGGRPRSPTSPGSSARRATRRASRRRR